MLRDPVEDALHAARLGDSDGFRVLWSHFNPRLVRYLAIRDPARYDDLASETWLQVIRDLHRFDGTLEDFRSWLFTLARHRSIDAARTARRRPAVLVAHVPDVALGDITEEMVMQRLSTASALALIRSLPMDQAEVVSLRLIADMDVQATAALLGKSAGAVRVLCHRGLKTLAADLSALAVDHR